MPVPNSIKNYTVQLPAAVVVRLTFPMTIIITKAIHYAQTTMVTFIIFMYAI